MKNRDDYLKASALLKWIKQGLYRKTTWEYLDHLASVLGEVLLVSPSDRDTFRVYLLETPTGYCLWMGDYYRGHSMYAIDSYISASNFLRESRERCSTRFSDLDDLKCWWIRLGKEDARFGRYLLPVSRKAFHQQLLHYEEDDFCGMLSFELEKPAVRQLITDVVMLE